ncbi:helix-turn-helix transcriptional regulator [Anaerocolumna sp. AGMB13025]|uniref:helix-turn-helix transcriptional regulator n=1 Tax=Anaerocolumna sp. AGMB13025 TaxID=3039116 RepID=UPI00241FE34C|nr:helix-turn-helix transcriptional regulator [Anaerocolumna sp. AGMB13025]WFR57037.1 helix-turn-helix transcriptional regulator [Anaerocolumna sp. AGMB13025]
MKYEHFGNLLQELRLKYNLSREKLAQDICTPKQIYRIEKGYSEPSIYLLHQLSIKFNLDLNEYYKMYFTKNSIIGLEGTKAINTAIESGDLPLLQSLISTYETLEDFKNGQNLQYIYYGKALCSSLIDKDYNTSLDYCYKGIQVDNPKFSIQDISNNIFSNIGISLLNCTSLNYFSLNQYNVGIHILKELLTVLETHYINPPYPLFEISQFSKKIYQAALCNISDILFEKGEVQASLNYVEKGIQFSIKEYNTRFLPDLFLMKLKILYIERKYEEARVYFDQTVYLYKITDKKNKLSNLVADSIIEYPEIFKEIKK